MKEKKIGVDYIGIGGGVLIFNKLGQILLQKRGADSRNETGKWSKPGGKIDFGETAIEAMKREVREETNLEIEIWGYLPHTDHIIKKENQHWIAINYLANLKSGDLKILEPHKCEKMKWFDIDKLPKKIVQTTKESVENFLKGGYIKIQP